MPARSNSISAVSLIFGVVSLILIISGLSIPLGALGIITGLLSRGNGVLDQRAKIGIALSLLGITIGICIIIWSFYKVTPEEIRRILDQYQNLSGA